METIGLLLFSSLFIFSGLTHLLKSSDMVAYTTAAFGNCPLAKQFGFLGGWPTGIFLTVIAVLVALGTNIGLWLALGFLVATQALFHRNLRDPCNWKHGALAASILIILAR